MAYTETFGTNLEDANVRATSRLRGRSIDRTRAVIALIVIGAIIRIALAGAVGFGTDESYTVANARYFDWSYVDYPPLHVWLVGLTAWLSGSEAPIVLRLPFIAFFAGSTWMMFRLTTLLFDDMAGVWAALLLNLAPVFTLAHASWVLPDGPLAFFMLSGSYIVARLLFTSDKPSRSIAGWAMAGLLAGLAMITKYHGAFLLMGVFTFLLTWNAGRRVLASLAPWIGATVAALIFGPVFLWNFNHDGVGLFFQTNRLTSAPHLSVARVFSAIISQSAYLTPWLFIPLAASWIVALKKGAGSPRSWFLALLASGPIIVFTSANFIARGLPHWPMPGWLFAFPLLGVEAARFADLRPKLVTYGCAASVSILLALTALFGTDGRTGWLANRFPGQYAHLDPTLDLLNWSELGQAISERRLIDEATPAIAATRWMVAGKINYAIGKTVPVLCLCTDPQQFRYLHDAGQFSGRNVVIIGARKDLTDSQVALQRWFTRVEKLPAITLHRAGEPVIQLSVVRGIDFRPDNPATRVSETHSRADKATVTQD